LHFFVVTAKKLALFRSLEAGKFRGLANGKNCLLKRDAANITTYETVPLPSFILACHYILYFLAYRTLVLSSTH
jgi:hypothetical protein